MFIKFLLAGFTASMMIGLALGIHSSGVYSVRGYDSPIANPLFDFSAITGVYVGWTMFWGSLAMLGIITAIKLVNLRQKA